MKRVMFISSTGGHFNELMRLEPLFEKYKVTLVTESSSNKKKIKNEYKKYHIHFLLKHSNIKIINYFNIFINCFISLF